MKPVRIAIATGLTLLLFTSILAYRTYLFAPLEHANAMASTGSAWSFIVSSGAPPAPRP